MPDGFDWLKAISPTLGDPENWRRGLQWISGQAQDPRKGIAQLTPYAADILQKYVPGGVPPETTVSAPTQAGKVQTAIEAKGLEDAFLGGIGDEETDLPGYATFSDAKKALPNDNWEVTE